MCHATYPVFVHRPASFGFNFLQTLPRDNALAVLLAFGAAWLYRAAPVARMLGLSDISTKCPHSTALILLRKVHFPCRRQKDCRLCLANHQAHRSPCRRHQHRLSRHRHQRHPFPPPPPFERGVRPHRSHGQSMLRTLVKALQFCYSNLCF